MVAFQNMEKTGEVLTGRECGGNMPVCLSVAWEECEQSQQLLAALGGL